MTCNKPVPSNINFGLIPPVKLNKEQRKDKKRKRIKKELASARAQESFKKFLESEGN
jgi:methylenetetrahydrofolate--tRNA-(uracil-5-)-methyltransferase